MTTTVSSPRDLAQLHAHDERFSLKLRVTPRHGYQHFWLHLDGVPVAYMKASLEEFAGATVLDLHDIEVREGWRSRGFSKVLRERAVAMAGVSELVHTGEYTPDGFERIAGRHSRCGVMGFEGPAYRPMTFVHDWDKLQPKFS